MADANSFFSGSWMRGSNFQNAFSKLAWIVVVRIDSTTCDRNMKENYFGVQNRVERFKGDGLLTSIPR